MLKIYRPVEHDLIDGCRRGNRKAQQRLYELFAPKMYPVCIRYMKDIMAAEDVLVMAFTRILEKIDQYSGKGSLEGWIKTIVIREAIYQLRRKSKDVQEVQLMDEITATHESIGMNVMNSYHQVMDQEYLLKLIEALPDGYRAVFNLYAIDGFSHKEIAEQLGISENTSKSQLSRARSFLQQRILEAEKLLIEPSNDKATPSY